MSGFDEKTGLFELTATKARYWLRRCDVEELGIDVSSLDWWELVQAVIRSQGLEIVRDGGNYLVVRATPEQLWEALSGKPSNPAVAARHRGR
jgi:hypothetical protein